MAWHGRGSRSSQFGIEGTARIRPFENRLMLACIAIQSFLAGLLQSSEKPYAPQKQHSKHPGHDDSKFIDINA